MKALTIGSLTAAALLGALPFTHAAAPQAVTLRVSPEREAVFRKGDHEVILELEVKGRHPDAGRHSPVNLSVVLDHSGSMEGAKLEKARQAASAALDRLEDDDVFSLVQFDSEAELLLPPERVGNRAHRDAMKDRIFSIRARSGTALYAGVQLGAKQVTRFLAKDRVNRVILLSDGLANEGPSRPADLANLGHDLAENGMSVSTIGLGEDFNEDLMTGLAEASHANYYYVLDAEKLPGIFAQELGAAGTRVAGDLRLRIEMPEGVRLRGVIGRPDIHVDERTGEIDLPELFGDEQRLFHLRCSFDAPNAATLPVASVTLTYEDTAAKTRESQNQNVSVRVTDDASESARTVQDSVAQNVAVLQNRIDKEEAIRLADAGKAKDAAALLRKRATDNAAAPAPQQLPNVAAENQKLGALADELSSRGSLGNLSRKSAQYDNYNAKFQKNTPPSR